MELKYGDLLEIFSTTNSSDKETDIVMLVNNVTSNDEFNCKVLDLSSKEIIADFKNIEDFKSNTDIIKIIGNFDKLFYDNFYDNYYKNI